MKNIKLTFVFFFSLLSLTYAQEIVSYSSLANAACSGVIASDANVTATGICRGPGIVANVGATYNSRDWTTTTVQDADDYLEWTVAPNSGFELNLSSMDIRYDRSGTGPTEVSIEIDTGSGFASVFTDNAVSASGENNTIDLSAYTAITGTVTFRLYAFNASGITGTFDIEEHTATSKGIIVNGTVRAVCASTVTWDGTNWTPGTPDITTRAIIDANYNTSTAPTGSFSACSLIVNSGNLLTISDGNFVTVQNDIDVDGEILVETQGNLVQNSNIGIVSVNAGGRASVDKTTAILNDWYEYTYWSSPVANETVDDGLFDAAVNRRFRFIATNFSDATRETMNDNATVPGQDDIDDDGNDWQLLAGSDIMTPGVGYAATHSAAVFIVSGIGYQYNFEGPFNNGIISVPVARDDAETNDINWNLIGNPYPSAIDADLFFAANTNLDDAIYLWSQNTAPSATANGNDNLNFAQADYAIINGTGETAGGDGVIPTRHIPSAQGFFVSYSDTNPSTSGTATFNNSMRVTGNNTQFFRTANTANKLRLDLTSDNGVFNQVLIGYLDQATDGYDGMLFDAPRNLSTGASTILYSTIENSDKKFAIQGKNAASLDSDEVIPLGFITTIDIPTLYTISIAQLQGDFLSNNTIYLKDNLQNTIHNLSLNDYTFTSEIGEFNNRFEIVFDPALLSVNDNELNNAFTLVELQNNNVKFSISNTNLTIKNVKIYDALGRLLYNLNGNSHTETYNLSNLSRAAYIAQVTLSNDYVITKKAIKR